MAKRTWIAPLLRTGLPIPVPSLDQPVRIEKRLPALRVAYTGRGAGSRSALSFFYPDTPVSAGRRPIRRSLLAIGAVLANDVDDVLILVVFELPSVNPIDTAFYDFIRGIYFPRIKFSCDDITVFIVPGAWTSVES